MGFPDRIERALELAHPPAEVWAALTTADMRVERVEEPTVFGFTWPIFGLPEDDPRRTYVEFTLEPAGSDTRLRVVETAGGRRT